MCWPLSEGGGGIRGTSCIPYVNHEHVNGDWGPEEGGGGLPSQDFGKSHFHVSKVWLKRGSDLWQPTRINQMPRWFKPQVRKGRWGKGLWGFSQILDKNKRRFLIIFASNTNVCDKSYYPQEWCQIILDHPSKRPEFTWECPEWEWTDVVHSFAQLETPEHAYQQWHLEGRVTGWF